MPCHVCRICLAGDNKTLSIVNSQFQDMYEKITGYKWARDDRPIQICYICKSQLQRSLKFQQMSKLSEEIFEQILAVGFEFTEEILPILYKRQLQTVEITPVSTQTIEPIEEVEINENTTEIKEKSHQKSLGNEEISLISNTVSNVYDLNNYHNNEDVIKEEIKIEDDSNTNESPEKILKMDTIEYSSNKDIKTEFHKNASFQSDFHKSYPLHEKAFVYIPTDLSSDENDKLIQLKNPKKDSKILMNEGNALSSTPNKNTPRKSITLIFKQHDIITPRKTLQKNVKQNKVTQESSKSYDEIEVPYNKNCKPVTGKGLFLEKYLKSKTEEKQFNCDICNRSYNQKKFLILHMRIHNGDRQFECDKCPKTYTRLHFLNRHKLCHLSKKPFTCKICQKGFNQRSNLDQHKRTHTGERPYPCKVCNKKFIQLSHLLQHNRVHTGEKPYNCICGKSFAQKGGLLHHRRTHMRMKPFTCDFCGTGFSQKSNLKNHIKSTHNQP